MSDSLSLHALPNFPLVEPGDNLAEAITESLTDAGLLLQSGDVLVVAQKIISKAENRYAYLNHIEVSDEAKSLAQSTEKDPRVVQLILDESVEVVRYRPGAIIVEHKLGYVHANAGIDQSNIESDDTNQRVLLLPENPDASASELRKKLVHHAGVELGVIINDSAGRAWRNGTLGFAIGSAGFEPVVDLVGKKDLFGRELEVTSVAVADELAAAASFLMGQAAEAVPVVLIRGAALVSSDVGSTSLIRHRDQDLFR